MMFISNDKMIGLPHLFYLILKNTVMMVRYLVINLFIATRYTGGYFPEVDVFSGLPKNHCSNTELIGFCSIYVFIL